MNPLVAAIVDATSQAAWFQYVKDLSGENSVVVGGRSRTISTRYSDAMFPTPQDNAHATEYLLEKAAGWGYRGVRETYTNAESGCGAQSAAWQNVVFTIPGQVDYDEHQQVLFVTHYDSLSYSVARACDYAPGADDAISGGSALLEALRLFKDYALPQHGEDRLLLRRGGRALRLRCLRPPASDRGHVARRQHGPDRLRRKP